MSSKPARQGPLQAAAVPVPCHSGHSPQYFTPSLTSHHPRSVYMSNLLPPLPNGTCAVAEDGIRACHQSAISFASLPLPKASPHHPSYLQAHHLHLRRPLPSATCTATAGGRSVADTPASIASSSLLTTLCTSQRTTFGGGFLRPIGACAAAAGDQSVSDSAHLPSLPRHPPEHTALPGCTLWVSGALPLLASPPPLTNLRTCECTTLTCASVSGACDVAALGSSACDQPATAPTSLPALTTLGACNAPPPPAAPCFPSWRLRCWRSQLVTCPSQHPPPYPPSPPFVPVRAPAPPAELSTPFALALPLLAAAVPVTSPPQRIPVAPPSPAPHRTCGGRSAS